MHPYRAMAHDPNAKWRWVDLTFLAVDDDDANGVAETKLGAVGRGHWTILYVGLCAPYAVAS